MKEHGLKHPERYSYEDIRRLIEGITTLKSQALICVLYGLGVRISECNTIKAADIERTILEVQGIEETKAIEVLRTYTKTLKNRTEHERFLFIVPKKEPWLVAPIEKYALSCTPTEIMFPQSRMALHKLVVKETGINPHGFRKIRGYHLVTKFNWTDQQLVKFMGWTDSRPAKYYIKLRGRDILPGI